MTGIQINTRPALHKNPQYTQQISTSHLTHQGYRTRLYRTPQRNKGRHNTHRSARHKGIQHHIHPSPKPLRTREGDLILRITTHVKLEVYSIYSSPSFINFFLNFFLRFLHLLFLSNTRHVSELNSFNPFPSFLPFPSTPSFPPSFSVPSFICHSSQPLINSQLSSFNPFPSFLSSPSPPSILFLVLITESQTASILSLPSFSFSLCSFAFLINSQTASILYLLSFLLPLLLSFPSLPYQHHIQHPFLPFLLSLLTQSH